MYRIRWAIVYGLRPDGERRCIAEKAGKILWLFPIWWPIGDWHRRECEAEDDIACDAALNKPLPTSQNCGARMIMIEVGELIVSVLPASSNGRTSAFEAVNRGSNPRAGAILPKNEPALTWRAFLF